MQEVSAGPGLNTREFFKSAPRVRYTAVGSTESSDATFPNVAGTFATAGGMDGFITVFTPVTSAPPIAVAGPAQSGDEDDTITFDASGSSDSGRRFVDLPLGLWRRRNGRDRQSDDLTFIRVRRCV